MHIDPTAHQPGRLEAPKDEPGPTPDIEGCLAGHAADRPHDTQHDLVPNTEPEVAVLDPDQERIRLGRVVRYSFCCHPYSDDAVDERKPPPANATAGRRDIRP